MQLGNWHIMTDGVRYSYFKNSIVANPYSFRKAISVHLLVAVLKIVQIQFSLVGIFSEEAQYWLWSLVPNWSYYSKPPLVAYVNMVSTYIFGVNEFGIRINALICGFLIGLIIYKLADDIFADAKVAFLSSISILAFPYFWIISFFFTPDSLLALFWTLSVWLGWRTLHKNRQYVWLLALAIGFGIISKFATIIFWPFFIIYGTIYHKISLIKLIPLIGISILFFIPFIIWNYHYDFLTMKHLEHLSSIGETIIRPYRSFNHLLEFLLGEYFLFILLFPWIFFHITIKLLKGQLKRENKYLFFPILFVLLFFAGLSLNTRIEVNWPFFAFPPFAVIVGRAMTGEQRQLYIRIGTVSSLIFIILFLPLMSVSLNFPGNINPFKRLMGWREVTKGVQDIMDNSGPAIKYHIITDSYQASSILSFYLKDHPLTYVLEYDRRMNQLDLWRDHLKPEPQDRFLVFTENREFNNDLFSELIDSLDISYPINQHEAHDYRVFVFKKFKGFRNYEFNSF